MELVRQEVRIDVNLSAQDAAKQLKQIFASVASVCNLNAAVLLNSTGKQLNLTSEK